MELDNEQTDSVSFLVNGQAGAVSLWLRDEIDGIPEWSSLPERLIDMPDVGSLSKQSITNENKTFPELNLFFAVLWKANVVNSDGIASTGIYCLLLALLVYHDFEMWFYFRKK